ncbi:MAG: hypothetical protein EZS28_038657 [Streblomastix strix]|uniref:Uncharacterized protein n=1 Tax=Streblomastix strix TaxID=222440 RepID=A0A5J4U4V5_9EUKA|nr:MAG: hypothetical protein EZS28_038657 [Streblomastix strix]
MQSQIRKWRSGFFSKYETIANASDTPPTGYGEGLMLVENRDYTTSSSNQNFKRMNISNSIVDLGGQSLYVVMTKLASWFRYGQLGEFVKGNYSDDAQAEINP